MSSPQLPANKTLQRWITFVHQRATSRPAEGQRVAELQRLSVIEYITLPVVRGSAAWWLIPELGASFDW